MYRFLIYSSIYLPGLALVIVVYGVQLAWGFPPRCNWTYGEVFHQLLFHNRISVSLWFGSLELNFICMDCISFFSDTSYILKSFQRINWALGLKRAAPMGCVCPFTGSNWDLEERTAFPHIETKRRIFLWKVRSPITILVLNALQSFLVHVILQWQTTRNILHWRQNND